MGVAMNKGEEEWDFGSDSCRQTRRSNIDRHLDTKTYRVGSGCRVSLRLERHLK